MNLKQELINEVFLEASDKIRTIDANAGLIAEAEALSERLRAHLPTGCRTGSPVACVTSRGIRAWVQIDYVPRHEIIAAIAGAGLRIAGESEAPHDQKATLIRLEGFDVPILDTNPRAELAKAA